MEGPEITSAETVIDNGSFGTRTVRFETGRLARQAAGSAVAYLDEETMLLSATTYGKNPKDHFDFFPLTVDVEERQYAAGKIPGSFFRREGRPSTDAILACRLIDRPLRPSFAKGLRNEVQVVETILSLHPDDTYDVLAINAASLSTQISGLPSSGPSGATRVALIDDQWVAFPRYSELERAVFSMVGAGRVVTDAQGNDDVAVMMVEAEATDNSWTLVKEQGATAPTEDVVAQGLEAVKPFILALCKAQSEVAASVSKPTTELPRFLDYPTEEYDAVLEHVAEDLPAAVAIADKQERENRLDELKAATQEALAGTFPDAEKNLSAAFRAATKHFIRLRVLRDGVRIDGHEIGRASCRERRESCEVQVDQQQKPVSPRQIRCVTVYLGKLYTQRLECRRY